MARIIIRDNARRKENKTFPYEMTELVWEDEKELEKSLRRDVRQIELQMKRRMFWRRCVAMFGS